MKRFFTILLLIISFTAFAQTTWYVSPAGNDSSQGDETNPFRTIKKAVKSAFEGDVINIDGGVYTNPITLNISRITLKAWHPENKPVIQADGPTFDTAVSVIRWTSNSISFYYNNNIIDGLIIKNALSAKGLIGIMINGNNNIIRNCELYGISRSGILVQGNNNLIEHNIISGIIGIPELKLAGNNISIESYYYNSDSTGVVRRNSEYNTVRYNILKNNSTHYGINIFPNTQDSLQQLMTRNEIYNNYIDSTGGGIYTRYQINMRIFNNFIVHSHHDTTWETTGGGITLDSQITDSHPLPLDGGSIRIYNNTIADNQYFGVKNITSNGLEIYNNIFVNNFTGQNGEGYGHILFFLDTTTITTANKINSNIYFGNGCWKWGESTICDFERWRDISKKDSVSFFTDPAFEDQANGDYKIKYYSPAKNKGRGLYFSGVTNDYFNNPRPYWNRNFDIGAHEVSDAQFKIGAVGIVPGTDIIHKLKSIGTIWERDTTGSYNISTDIEIDSSTFITSGDYTDKAKENWHGFTYKWIYPEIPDSNSKYGIGFYKLTNSFTGDSIFIDARQAALNSSPNIFIRLNNSVQPSTYEYFDGKTFKQISSGSILRVWHLNNSQPNTSLLKNYWQQNLIWVNNSGRPKIIWGASSDSAVAGYRLYKRISEKNPFTFIQFSKDTMEYTDDFVLSDTLLNKFPEYYVTTIDTNNIEGTASNIIKITNADDLPKPIFSNALLQNYPNPFNLGTTIAYSIASDGNVKITLYDILGRSVKNLMNEIKPAGTYQLSFNAAGLASGVYFYKITSGSYTQIKKLQLLK